MGEGGEREGGTGREVTVWSRLASSPTSLTHTHTHTQHNATCTTLFLLSPRSPLSLASLALASLSLCATYVSGCKSTRKFCDPFIDFGVYRKSSMPPAHPPRDVPRVVSRIPDPYPSPPSPAEPYRSPSPSAS